MMNWTRIYWVEIFINRQKFLMTSKSCSTLYIKLYAVLVRIYITRESYHQHPWVISSVPVRVCITRESYLQYPWGYAVPVSHIISTRESYPHRYCISSRVLRIWLMGTGYPHGYWWYDSRVMHILTGTAYSLYRVCTFYDVIKMWPLEKYEVFKCFGWISGTGLYWFPRTFCHFEATVCKSFWN